MIRGESPNNPAVEAPQPAFAARLKVVLALAVAGFALKIPFQWSLLHGTPHSGVGLPVAETIALALTIPVGLSLSTRIGLDATPIIDRWLVGQPIAGRLAWAFLAAAVVAVGITILNVAKNLTFPEPPGHHVAGPALHVLLLAGAGAGLDEEAQCRLGLMVCIYWLLGQVPVLDSKRLSIVRFLLANLIQAVYFGLRHQLIQLGAWHGLSLISAATSGQALAGFVWGFLFWGMGYETAALSHSILDSGIVLLAMALAHRAP